MAQKSAVNDESNRLSGGDALFLHLEREGMPLNVASVSIFEGAIALNACTRFIESKLPLIPRYRQRVVTPPFNIGLPTWEYDSTFDIRNHVHELKLTHGTDAELKAVAGKILSKVLDRQRPLWDFTLVQGLKGNRTAIITRMHHCMADGLAGVALLNVLMDTSPKVPRLRKRKLPVPEAKRKDTATQLLDGLLTSSSAIAQRILAAQMEFVDVIEKVAAADRSHAEAQSLSQPGNNAVAGMPTWEEFTRFMPEVTSITQRLPFNLICRGAQKFDWAEIPLAEMKAVKNAYGATINDVVLTIVTSTVRRYVEMRGVQVRGRLLRLGVPVSVRRSRNDANANTLGNRITFIPVTVPLDVRSPRKLLAAVRERVAFLRRAHVAELVGLAGSMLGAIPMAAQVVAGSIANELPLGLCNLVCTNIPGPEAQLYLMSHKLLRCYPYVPIGGDLGLNCAVLTYDGIAHFGFSGNVLAAPRMDRLASFLKVSFAELQQAAPVSAPSRRSKPRKAKPRKAKPRVPAERVIAQSDFPPAIPNRPERVPTQTIKGEKKDEFPSAVAV